MPAIRKRCELCNKKFWATRKDARFCRELCRSRNRSENGKFTEPTVQKSGVRGILYCRIHKRWTVWIRYRDEEGKRKWKYVGMKSTKEEAIEFQQYVMKG